MNEESSSHLQKPYAKTWKSVKSVAFYAKSRYRNIDQKYVSWRETAIINRFLKSIDTMTDRSILDVPTGYGRFTQTFLENDLDITSADLNLYALMYQRQRYLETSNIAVSDVFNLPFRDEQFNIVFNFRLLQHFQSRSARLQIVDELRRVSSRWLIMSVYVRSKMHTVVRQISSRPKRIWMADLKLLKNDINKAGFRIAAIKSIIPYLHAQRILLLEKR